MDIGTLTAIVTLVAAIISLAVTVITLGIKFGKAISVLIKNKDRDKIVEIIKVAMAQAEQTGKTGADKKQMVLDSVEASLKELGIDCDLDSIGQEIEQLITLINAFVKK